MTRQQRLKLAEFCADAYSAERYVSWPALVAMLDRRGYSVHEIEAILRSKWTRWAADAAEASYGKATSVDLARFLDKMSEAQRRKGVAELAAGTYPHAVELRVVGDAS